MNAEATILKAKSIYVEMAEVEKEKAMHDERSKECKKRIEGMQAQVKELVNAVDGPQAELNLDSPALGIFACVEGEMHDWQRIRDDEERSLETCENCGGERVYDKTDEKPEWVYTFPQSEPAPAVSPSEEPVS
jgi:hypothetical protein